MTLRRVSAGLALLMGSAMPVLAQLPGSEGPLGLRASYLGDLVQSTVNSLENAFRRRTAVLASPSKDQVSALELGALFPSYGFAPPLNSNLTWSLTGVSSDVAKLCVGVTVTTTADWNRLVSRLHREGMHPSNSACEEVARYSLAPAGFPATLHAIRTLDRRDTPVATSLSSYPEITGADAAAVTRPGLLLAAGTPATLTVFNPFTLVDAGPLPMGLTLGLTGLSVREGFSVSHTCSEIAPAATCTVTVRYGGGYGPSYPGSLRLEFSNGAVAVVGLLGVTP